MKDDRQRIGFDLGFAPDADPLAAGVVTDCVNFVPTTRGMQTLPAPEFNGSNGVFTTQPVNGYWVRPSSDTYEQNVEYASTRDKLYIRTDRFREWSDITASGKLYPTGFWSITAFGPVVIGAEGGDVVQRPAPIGGGLSLYTLPTTQNGGEQAATIAGSPTCCIVTTAERFVLAFNGRGGDSDTWNCSARDNHASWTLSPSTLAAQGRLVEPYGPIIAAVPMGNDVMVYKPTGVIRGRFVPGDAEVWKWQKVPVRIGAESPRAVCELPDGRHAVMNAESCWLFDGAQAVDVLAGKARRWYQRSIQPIGYQYGGMAAIYNADTNCIWFSFRRALSVGSYGSFDSGVGALVYDLTTGKLGQAILPADLLVETAQSYTPGLRTVGYFEMTTHRLMAFPSDVRAAGCLTADNSGAGSGVAVRVELTTGDTGDPFDLIDVTGIKPDLVRGYDYNDAASVDLYSRDIRDASTSESGQVTPLTAQHIAGGDRYAVRASAHWHRIRLRANGTPLELSGMWLRAATRKSERGG